MGDHTPERGHRMMNMKFFCLMTLAISFALGTDRSWHKCRPMCLQSFRVRSP